MNQYNDGRSPDPIDQAANLDLMYTAQNVTKARLAAQPEQSCVNGVWETEFCVDCGEDIEPYRLAMGRVRCFGCQDFKERSVKLGRR